MGLMPIFLGEREGGGLKNFVIQKGGGPEYFCAEIFLHQAPLTSVCEQSLVCLKYKVYGGRVTILLRLIFCKFVWDRTTFR